MSEQTEIIRADLSSSDISRQLHGIEALSLSKAEINDTLELSTLLYRACTLLENSENPLLIAEKFASRDLIPDLPLAEYFSETSSREGKLLAALLMLHRHVRTGVSILLEEIRKAGPYRNLASATLTRFGITDHVPEIIEILRNADIDRSHQIPTTEDDEILNYLSQLKQLNVSLPKPIKEKFGDPKAPIFFRRAVF